MARIRDDECRWCTPALIVALVLVGWFGFVHGPARPDQLRLRAEQSVDHDLSAAGFPWAKLQSRGDTAVLTGEAPSDEARQAAAAAADVLLARFTGWPGVYAQVDKKLQLAAVSEADRMALARTSQPLDLPATSAGPVDTHKSADAAKAAAGSSRASTDQLAALAPTAAAATAAVAPATPVAANAAALGTGATQRPDPACKRELEQVQQRTPLRFKAGSASLDLGQDDGVESLAGLLKRCSVGRVLVHGLREASGAFPEARSGEGAESEGGDKASPIGSLLLAQRRAQAVRAELIAHGVAVSRLQLGAGAREVLGDTPARVELTLAPADRP
jgi:outer membrane protein OmpA-like peptidoglycan-associated protein